MKFTKMHGTGNDYVYVNGFDETVPDASNLAIAIADRHTGVGGDGLIIIQPSDVAVARMEMYNADGSRGGMCGNGIRCVAKYLYDHGLTTDATISIDTDDGIKTAECSVVDGRVATVTIDMGVPRFAPGEIPMKLEGDRIVERPIEVNGRELRMTCLSMGNPHAVVFVDDFSEIVLDRDGPALEGHRLFPDRVNVHFVVVCSRARARVLHWERGSGPTKACGTGVCAVCVAGVVTDRMDRRIVTEVPGGELELRWSEDGHVFMAGPAVEVFSGDWVL
jgi:diaminopimelate epimerase